MRAPKNLDYEFCKNVRYLHVDEQGIGMLFDGYNPGDPLVCVYEGQVRAFDTLEATAEATFVEHNRDDRPTAHFAPSMSVGDVVIIHTPDGTVAMSCEPMGFTQVDIPPDEDIERTKSYKQVVDEATRPAEDLPLEDQP